jgi:hypothetical protein
LQTEIGLGQAVETLSDPDLEAVRTDLLARVESSFAGTAEALMAAEIDAEICQRRRCPL